MAVNLTLGVVGLGFVGGAVFRAFQEKGCQVIGYDKFKDGGVGRPEDIVSADYVFLCLPTPFSVDKPGYDLRPIYDWCEYLYQHHFKGVIVIKSTVLPGNAERLAEKFKLKIVHNPEFLSARTAYQDFMNQKHIVLGRTDNVTNEEFEQLIAFYGQHFPNAEISTCRAGEAEAMKVFVNSFYAVKIQLFNEFYLLGQKFGLDYEVIRNLMLKNGWINPMHTQVPGTDGKFSYGGNCFPKDTRALSTLMQNLNSPNRVLKGCILEQEEMRSECSDR